MGVLLKDVAKSLNLSKATVSWILSGQGKAKGFSDTTIALVQERAKEMGYSPNLLARSLSVGSTRTLGLIIPAIDDTFYSQMAEAVEKRAHTCGYTLIISTSERDGKKEQQLIETLRAQQVDGLIIAPAKGELSAIRAMLRSNYPFVFIDRYYPMLRSNYVIVNNEQSSYDLVSRLIDKGSRKIALMTTDTHLMVMNMRIRGYCKALAKAGIKTDNSLFVSVNRADYSKDIITKLDELLQQHPDVDGFFFSTHYLALETMRYFIKNNIDYHRRFNMACFHTTTALDILAPEMIVSLMPIEQMGASAVDILMENIKQKDSFKFQEIVLQMK